MAYLGDPDATLSPSKPITAYATYEDYLDSQITALDMYYFETEDLGRQLVELGYRGDGDTLKKEEFEARKRAEAEKHTMKYVAVACLSSLSRRRQCKHARRRGCGLYPASPASATAMPALTQLPLA